MKTCFIKSMLLVSVFTILVGCSEKPQIELHRVPKDRSGLEKLRQSDSFAPATAANQGVTEETRMAVAIFENPDATWFFKVSGPAEQVAKTEDQWKTFFKTVKFTDGQPLWDMPEHWSTGGPKPMRHSTLIIGDTDPPLELAISSLGPNQDLLLNINRWRGQIGLSPSTAEQLDGQIEKLESDGGKYLLFDAVGIGSGQMRPPFAGGAAPFAGRAPLPGNGKNGSGTKSKKLTFETPEGWSEGPASAIVHARLIKKVDAAEVQITVIEMPADANEWEPNVTRWANQVGMENLSAEQIAERVSELMVDGVPGNLVDLVDLESDSPTGTIAGMVKRDGSAWFLKLTGDKKMVIENRGTFETFLGSIRFN